MFRAHRLKARGMTGIFRMVMIDTALFDEPILDDVPFDDGAFFDDGAGWAGEYEVRCDAGAKAGDTTIVVNIGTANGPIVQGQILSHNDYPFVVTSIYNGELEVEMPLRADIPAGDMIRLQGRGLFEMVQPMTGNPTYGPGRISATTMELQEWLR